jgi:hypothetical protein
LLNWGNITLLLAMLLLLLLLLHLLLLLQASWHLPRWLSCEAVLLCSTLSSSSSF